MCDLDLIKATNSVDEMRSYRTNPSVYKVEIASTSSDLDKIVVVVEGRNDPGVYRVWFKHFLPNDICKKINFNKAGDKKKVLEVLKKTVGSDKFKKNIYFIVDHDFNGNLDVIDENLLVLDAYSIENYIFTKDMVEEILECNFHIEDAEFRKILSTKYHENLLSFLSRISDLNFLIYYAVNYNERPFQMRKEKNDFSKHLQIEPNSCEIKSGINIIEKLIHNISPDRVQEILELSEERIGFNNLQPIHLYYRGKFIEGFFDKWIEMLVQDINSSSPELFHSKPDQAIKFSPSTQDLSFYASKMRVPLIIESFFSNHLLESTEEECVA